MYEKLVEAIDQLGERESKRILLHLFQEAEMAGQVPDEKRLTKSVRRMYEDLIHLQPEQPLTEAALSYWHIVFGDSAAGSLKVGLGGINARRGQVIAVTTDLSNGPLTRLDELDGWRNRMAWLKDVMDGYPPYDNDSIDSPADQLSAIKAIPEHVPVTIWASDNAWEQCGLDLVVYLLRGRTNSIRVINPSAYEKKLLGEFGEGVRSACSGELLPVTLAMLFKKYAQSPPLTENKRRQLENEWRRVSGDPSLLRIWTDDRVHPVMPDHFDAEILRHARKLARQKEYSHKGFPCVRLITAVIFELRDHQWVGDTFIYWRIKALIDAGKMTGKKYPNQIFHTTLTLN
ncbi:DUF1835 domain-containing protein [Sporolactobacillus shoreicorticis]|uniref:DUF1835 domain-containing protein n=1 Tax=Sporolactobacillus shoreicorticis TaxID=1923877 RepID=A0ABW5RZK9_9BACL|nr:DUF1835 domain-containing protein [Sporolactobacillus shoreicorticis]MCO7127227.1 DUF1835 domain-containing protein [Sporolactobacillus shoreicorticis]